MGNNVYEVIKLIEPHCTYQMSLITHKNRPLIPRNSKFRYYLSSALIELSREYNIDPQPFIQLTESE